MQGWAKDPAFAYRSYTTDEADAYIADRFAPEVLAAFRQCGVPAMQADFFRYCALYSEGGIWVDADTQNIGKLADALPTQGRGLLMNRDVKIANDFLFVREAGDPLFLRVIEQAVANIAGNISNNVWLVTGPGIMTKLHRTRETTELFDGFEIRPVKLVREVVRFRHNLEYKKSQDDWRNNLESEAPSIFKASNQGNSA